MVIMTCGAGSADRRFALGGARQAGAMGAVADDDLAAHVAKRVGAAIAAIGEMRADMGRHPPRRRHGEVVQEAQRLPADGDARAA